jgi:hypothetical protein
VFQIDRKQNRILRLEEKRFGDLKLQERKHLQEWLANMPTALGEELLIIQKEFDGFNETRERLDLLALDKEGQLVIIENKLDDTGRDVVWQAVKYAAYVSTLNKVQIVEIFQAYLDRYCGGGNAVEKICEFLDADGLDELVLNSGQSQRLMMIAAKFRKEVTATALWLLGHGIRAQCFRVTPYAHGDELFLDIQQIIPVPEAETFMIGMSAKESEEKSAQGTLKRRHTIRQEFWEQALEAMRKAGQTRYQNVSPSHDHWVNCGSGIAGCYYTLIFSISEARVELSIQRSSAEENKWLFDALHARRAEIEAAFGAPLDWKRLDTKKSSRFGTAKDFEGYNKENWPAMIAWMVDNMERFEAAVRGPLQIAGQGLKQRDEPA